MQTQKSSVPCQGAEGWAEKEATLINRGNSSESLVRRWDVPVNEIIHIAILYEETIFQSQNLKPALKSEHLMNKKLSSFWKHQVLPSHAASFLSQGYAPASPRTSLSLALWNALFPFLVASHGPSDASLSPGPSLLLPSVSALSTDQYLGDCQLHIFAWPITFVQFPVSTPILAVSPHSNLYIVILCHLKLSSSKSELTHFTSRTGSLTNGLQSQAPPRSAFEYNHSSHLPGSLLTREWEEINRSAFIYS